MNRTTSPLSGVARGRLLGIAGGLVALLCTPGGAEAVQIAGNSTDPANTEILECLNCTVTLTWTIVNTGAPRDAAATLGLREFVSPFIRTDYLNDVVQVGATTQGMAGQCGMTLAAASRCTVQAIYNIRDADPFDQGSAVNDFGQWVAGLDVNWRIGGPGGGADTGSVVLQREITVRDDAAPEPSAWSLMIVGLGIAGGALRGAGARRRREGRT